jgi:hypothetical protein
MDNEEERTESEIPGGVAEWSMAAVLKTAVLAREPGVRIPSPPLTSRKEIQAMSTPAHQASNALGVFRSAAELGMNFVRPSDAQFERLGA